MSSKKWSEVSLTEVADVFNGKTPSKAEQRTEGHPVLKIKNVSDDQKFRGVFGSFVDKDMANKFKSKFIQLNDSLILNAAHNASYVGKKQYRAEKKVVNSLPTGEWLIVRSNTDNLDAIYLNYWLRLASTRFKISHLIKGIHLYPKDIARLKISLPSRTEQQKIAAILDAADQLRQKDQQLIDHYTTLSQSLFLEMFGDPVTNPMGWEITAFNECLDGITGGKSVGGEERLLQQGEKAVIKISAVTSGIFNSTQYKVVEPNKVPEILVSPSKGELLFSRANTREMVGATCVVDANYENLFLPDKIWQLDLKPAKASNWYIKFLLTHEGFRESLRKVATGTSGSMLNISKAKLKQLKIPLPPIALQNQFAQHIEKIEQQKQQAQASLEQSETLFNSLLQRAFKGELT